jgi:transposase-like protein
VKYSSRRHPSLSPRSAFAGFRFPPDVIVVAVRLYLRCNLSYCDVAELLIERGVEVDHVTVFRLVQCFTPLLADAARFCRHAPADRWYVDETYDKVNGLWRYVSSAPAATPPRHAGSSARAMTMLKVRPTEVITDAAPVYPAVLDELVPSAWHHIGPLANNRVEADHSQLKRRLRPMRGLQTDRTAQTIIAGHACMQILRRGHYELGLDAPRGLRVAAAFTNPPKRSDRGPGTGPTRPSIPERNGARRRGPLR